MGHTTLSVEGIRGRLACLHEQLSGADSLAHLSRPQQRARLATRLLAPFQRFAAADFELLLIDWVEAKPTPTVIEMCTLLAALLAVDEAEKAGTLAELIAETLNQSKPSGQHDPDGRVVWWAHCICERCIPLAKHLPEVQRKLQKSFDYCNSLLPALT